MPKKVTEAEVNELLLDNNPYEKGLVVKDQNIWGTSLPDVPELNKEISDEILSTIESLHTSSEKIASVGVRAERGSGKTHIISRLRKRIQAGDSGVLVYFSMDKVSDLRLINLSLQQAIADSLDRPGYNGLTQWQSIAYQVVAEALKVNSPKANVPSPQKLIESFDQVYARTLKKGTDIVVELAKIARRLHPEADIFVIRAIIWTLSEERGMFAVKWLAGDAISAVDAVDLRLPDNGKKSTEELGANAIRVAIDTISFISEYKSVLICLDEIDSYITNVDGLLTPHSVAIMVKGLFNSLTLSEKSNGVMIATFVLPTVWQLLKETGGGGGESADISMSRLSSESEPLDLRKADGDVLVQLVSLWMKAFYQRHNIEFDNLIHPFSVDELMKLGKTRPNVREALRWCSKELPIKIEKIEPVTKPLTAKERFEAAYAKALQRSLGDDDLDDNDLIAAVLRFSFEKIISLGEQGKLKESCIENVCLEAIEDITPKSKNNGYLNFKIVGKEDNETVAIGLQVMQQGHALSVSAGFKRLLDNETFGLTRGCLVRASDRKIKRNWDSYAFYQELIEKGGEWVYLKEEELMPLVALKRVYDNHDNHDLSIKMLDYFAFTRDTLVNNPLIKEILSRPPGVVVEDALEGEQRQHFHSAEEAQIIAQELSAIEEQPEDDAEGVDLGELEAV